MVFSVKAMSFNEVYLKRCTEKRAEPFHPLIINVPQGRMTCDVDFLGEEQWLLITSAMRSTSSGAFQEINLRRDSNRGLLFGPRKSNRAQSFASLERQYGVPQLSTNMLQRIAVGVSQLLRLSPGIQMLQLRNLRIGAQGLTPILESLPYCLNLRFVSLAGTEIGDEACRLLVADLRKLPQLEGVDVSGCKLTDQSAVSLGNLVRGSITSHAWQDSLRQPSGNRQASSLKSFNLASNYLSEVAFCEIAKAVLSTSSSALSTLDVSSNAIQSSTAILEFLETAEAGNGLDCFRSLIVSGNPFVCERTDLGASLRHFEVSWSWPSTLVAVRREKQQQQQQSQAAPQEPPLTASLPKIPQPPVESRDGFPTFPHWPYFLPGAMPPPFFFPGAMPAQSLPTYCHDRQPQWPTQPAQRTSEEVAEQAPAATLEELERQPEPTLTEDVLPNQALILQAKEEFAAQQTHVIQVLTQYIDTILETVRSESVQYKDTLNSKLIAQNEATQQLRTEMQRLSKELGEKHKSALQAAEGLRRAKQGPKVVVLAPNIPAEDSRTIDTAKQLEACIGQLVGHIGKRRPTALEEGGFRDAASSTACKAPEESDDVKRRLANLGW